MSDEQIKEAYLFYTELTDKNNIRFNVFIEYAWHPITLNTFLETESLNENEIKLGHALYDIFNDYEQIFIGNDNNKFNKNIILLTLREMTNLTTKEIRSSMKRYKVMYVTLIQKMVK